MVQHLEAVFEQGVLRPLRPLALEEQQHVLLTVTDIQSAPATDVSVDPSRAKEQEWIREHGSEYPGEWVALQGSELISHGPKLRTARDEARAKGIQHPLMVHLPDGPELPSAGWL
jgi:predicted DNA-binding antitoxin AbrB/MazE fold protein